MVQRRLSSGFGCTGEGLWDQIIVGFVPFMSFVDNKKSKDDLSFKMLLKGT